jgi:hypothetical protein
MQFKSFLFYRGGLGVKLIRHVFKSKLPRGEIISEPPPPNFPETKTRFLCKYDFLIKKLFFQRFGLFHFQEREKNQNGGPYRITFQNL